MQQMIAEDPPRRDPAPSRWAYRMHRLWLTPLFRKLLRTGIPAFVLVLSIGWVATDTTSRETLRTKISELRQSVAERPEFMVRAMAIDGASEGLAEDIREILPVDFPISSFDLDLPGMKSIVVGLDAVAEAELRIRPGGVLHLEVTERIPMAVWRVDGGLELLDASGRRVAPLSHRAERADLPLLAGERADNAVPEALALIAAARPLDSRLRGLVRVGERRWDVVLDRGQRIMLPETNPVPALERVIALDQAQDVLARDLVAVDLRHPERPTLRIRHRAIEELRRIRAIEAGELDE